MPPIPTFALNSVRLAIAIILGTESVSALVLFQSCRNGAVANCPHRLYPTRRDTRGSRRGRRDAIGGSHPLDLYPMLRCSLWRGNVYNAESDTNVILKCALGHSWQAIGKSAGMSQALTRGPGHHIVFQPDLCPFCKGEWKMFSPEVRGDSKQI